MKASDAIPDTNTIRKLARQYADGEGKDLVDMWPVYHANRRSLEGVIAELIGLPWEHRRRVYYKLALLTAMNAYDARMALRQRKLTSQEGGQ